MGHDKIFLSGASLMGILLSIFSQGLGDAMHVMWHCCQQSSMDRPRSSPSYIEQHVRTDVTKFVVVSVGARVVTPRARSQACFRCAHPRKTGRAVLQALGIASKHGTKKGLPPGWDLILHCCSGRGIAESMQRLSRHFLVLARELARGVGSLCAAQLLTRCFTSKVCHCHHESGSKPMSFQDH